MIKARIPNFYANLLKCDWETTETRVKGLQIVYFCVERLTFFTLRIDFMGPPPRNFVVKLCPYDRLSPQPPHFQVWRVSTMLPASAQWHFFKCPAAHPREIACFTPAAEKASKTAVSLYAK